MPFTRIELFRQQAAEFNNIPDSEVNNWFDSSMLFLARNISKIPTESLDLAVALYTAHLIWLSKYPGQGGASRGPITNEKDPRYQKQYALIKNSDTWLGQSYYGQMFTDLTGIFDRAVGKSAIMTRFGTNPSFRL